MTTTKIILKDNKELNVRGTVEEIVKAYNNKPNTVVFESRIDDNYMIQIKGVYVGTIINPIS